MSQVSEQSSVCVQWPKTSRALPPACRYLLPDGNLPACSHSWTNLLFFTTTKHRERLHQKSPPRSIPTKNVTSRIRWHSSGWGTCRVAPRGRVAPWGGISSCPWIPSTRGCCRVGPSSCWGVSFRNSGIGVLTGRWVHWLLSCWLKHRNGMFVHLLTGH